MKKILFVCHGNICRSTMAEYVMKDLVKKEGLSDLFFHRLCRHQYGGDRKSGSSRHAPKITRNGHCLR